MTGLTDFFFAIRTNFVTLITLAMGDSALFDTSFSLLFDCLLWAVWLWLVFHLLFKPFIYLFKLPIMLYKNTFFKELEIDEKE